MWNKLIPDLIESYNVSRSNIPVDNVNYYPVNKVPTVGDQAGAANEILKDEKGTGLINLAKQDDDERNIFVLDNSLPISIIVIIGLIIALFNLLFCAGVYYQKQKVKRREMNLERRIKRMSDAGFVMDESASHQSGLIVDSNVDRETRTEGHYGNLNTSSSQPPSKRPHFQLRSNSVRGERENQSAEQSKIVLKSALKKSNTSAEILTDNKCLLYSDQTFVDAAYPSIARQSKSIPNINHLSDSQQCDNRKNDNSLSRMSKEKPLSKSSNFLEKEKRRGADELVIYDSMPSPPGTLERKGSSGTSGKLSSLASSLLRGSGIKKDGRPPSPIIEMVPTTSSTPSTYNFPSRQMSNGGEPIYTTRPILNPCLRPPAQGPVATPYGIAYPVYGHTGSLPRPMYPRLPHDGYISMVRPGLGPGPGLTTPQPRPGLRLPLGPDSPSIATLPRMQGPGFEAMRHPGHQAMRPGWTGSLREPPSNIYGTRPPLSRMNSVDSNNSMMPPGSASLSRMNSVEANMPPPMLSMIPASLPMSRTAPDLVPVKMTNATSQTPQAQLKPSSSLPQQSTSPTTSVCASSVSTISTSLSSSISSSSPSPSSTTNQLQQNGKSEEIFKNPFEEISQENVAIKERQEKLNDSKSEGTDDEIDDKTVEPNVVVAPKTPVLRKVGEKTPPNTLRRDRPQSSCKSWYSQYSQGFLSKTIDTPDIELPPLGDENDDDETNESKNDVSADTSPNNERKAI